MTIVGTRGHTAGHVSVVLEEDDHLVFFAGDTSYTEAIMVEGRVDGVSVDSQAARQALERIQRYARERPMVYLPSHDPESAQRLRERRAVASSA